jgi:transposase-like protein
MLKVGVKSMADGTIEIITGKERRRRWGAQEKLRIVAEASERGARVTDVAARPDDYPSLLVNWRRRVREGWLGTAGSAGFVPIRLLSSAPETIAAPPEDRSIAGIEITLAGGTCLRITHQAQLPRAPGRSPQGWTRRAGQGGM